MCLVVSDGTAVLGLGDIGPEASMPVTAPAEFRKKGREDPLFAGCDYIVKERGGIWRAEAEKYLLVHAKTKAEGSDA